MSPYRTGPRRPARGCASGQCLARLVGAGPKFGGDVANVEGGNGGRKRGVAVQKEEVAYAACNKW